MAAGLLERQSGPGQLGWGKSRRYVAGGLPSIGGNFAESWWRLLLVDKRLSVSAKVTEAAY